jgi:hypothetical protein
MFDSGSVFNDSHFPGRRSGPVTPAEVKAVLAEVGKMVADKHWPADDRIANTACQELATTCDRFLKLAGARVAIKRAVATGVPIRDDGIPVKGHVSLGGEKFYTREDIEEAKLYFEKKDPAAGRVFTREELEAHLMDISAGRVGVASLQLEPFAVLGVYGTGLTQTPLFFERDAWNALRTQRQDVITMRIVNVSLQHGGKHGWES